MHFKRSSALYVLPIIACSRKCHNKTLMSAGAEVAEPSGRDDDDDDDEQQPAVPQSPVSECRPPPSPSPPPIPVIGRHSAVFTQPQLYDDYYSASFPFSAPRSVRAAAGAAQPPPRLPPATGRTLARHVDYFRMREFLRRLDQTNLHKQLCDKLWESVCPQGIDLSYYVCGRPLSPAREVLEEIRTRWTTQVQAILYDMLTVGYAVVLYGVSDDDGGGGGVVPRVLDPEECILWWTESECAVRVFTPRPAGALAQLCPPDASNQPAFSCPYDIFWWKEPRQNGMWQSKALEAYRLLVSLDQLSKDYLVCAHEHVNQLLVVQSREPPYGSLTRRGGGVGGGEPLVPGTAGAAGRTWGRGGAENRTPVALQQSLSMHMFATSAMTASDARLRQTMARESVCAASCSAEIMGFEVGESDTGASRMLAPPEMWQRGVLALPPNAEIGHTKPADLPAEFALNLRHTLSQITSTYGVPADVILGAVTGVRASSTLSQEQLRATVLAWRTKLAGECLPQMYWRVFGAAHGDIVSAAAARERFEFSDADAESAVVDCQVIFTFRSNSLDPDKARALWREGVLSDDGYRRYQMTEFGLDRRDMTELALQGDATQPEPEPEPAPPPTKRARSSDDQEDEEHEDEDARRPRGLLVGDADVGGVGFVRRGRAGAPARRETVTTT